MLHVMLPVQYLRRNGAGFDSPQRRLMMAVLQTVLDDCQNAAVATAVGTGTSRDPRALRQALDYLENRDRSWPYSFDNICEAVGFDAEGIRRVLRQRADRSDRTDRTG